MKWVQKNPAVVMIFAVAVVVIIALIVMTATRKKSDNDKNEEVGGSGKPEIEVLGMNKMLLPMDKTETYMIQEGYSIAELAKNVNFTLRWNNKGGMESVKTLIFKRFSPNNTLVSTETIQRTEANPYFVPFSENNSYVFEGSAISSNTDLIGINVLQIMYVLEGETTEEILFDSSVSFVGSNQVRITDEDLSIIEITDIVQTVTYTPTVSAFSISKDFDDKNYYLYPGGGSLDVHWALFKTRGPIKFLPAQDTGATTYKSSLFYIYFPDNNMYLGMGNPYVYQQCASGYELAKAGELNAGKCVSKDGRNCVYPNSYGDEQYCEYDGRRSRTFTPLTRRDIALSNRASALKFRITNSTTTNRYRFQTSDGLFIGKSSDKLVMVNINDQFISNTLYKTIDIQVLQDEK